ncbi:MAG: hypothetical protein B7Y47_12670 [Sphingomonas sp. 28-63-12]|nr:MAG: hypothetical protein B7Y47_12670 [Sphingomonas sp. 28-63-12]
MIVVIWRFPDAAWNRSIRRIAVEPLARQLMKLERRHLLFALAMIAVLMLASELLAMAGSLDVGVVVLWDISTYVDILIVASVTGISARAQVGWQTVKHAFWRTPRFLRHRPRGRTRQAHRERPAAHANDDERPATAMLVA